MSDYDYDSVTNNLRDSANGTFVTLDDFSLLTDTASTACPAQCPLRFTAFFEADDPCSVNTL